MVPRQRNHREKIVCGGSQNPLVVLAAPPTTLVRGRTEPEEEGRAEDDAPLLLAEAADVPPDGFPADEGVLLAAGFPPVEGLALVDGLPPVEGLALVDGLPVEDGLALVDGELAEGADGFSDAGGTVACANGAPPPFERL